MAVTITKYNHTRKLFANQQIALANIKLMLLTGHTFSAAHTAIASISGDQVSGNGWTAGGITLSGAAVTVVNTNEAMLDAADVGPTATGGDIGPATAAVLYDATGNFPLYYIDFDGTQTAGVGTPFNVVWSANGIDRWTA
jgi:hypothetical protein